jgi:hypothetical protein
VDEARWAVEQELRRHDARSPGGRAEPSEAIAVAAVTDAIRTYEFALPRDASRAVPLAWEEIPRLAAAVVRALRSEAHPEEGSCERCLEEAEELRVVGPDHRNTADYTNSDPECPDCGARWPDDLPTEGSEHGE